ncbi:Thermostable alkaline protease [Paramyrothecium foliicola]|nr:Thermostable alkaline protease [Paramyrothecium foliicola]
MPALGSGSVGLPALWELLRAIHPLFLFSDSLPRIDSAENGQCGSMEGASLEAINNDITTLRSDVKLNIIKQHLIDVEQLGDLDDGEELEDELHRLLGMFEELVKDTVLNSVEDSRTLDCCSTYYPKLTTLRALLRANPDSDTTSFSNSEETEKLDDDAGLNWSKQYSDTRVTTASAYITHLRDPEDIAHCKAVVARFGAVVAKVFDDAAGLFNAEAQAQYYTDAEVEIIKHAHDFASGCTTLFHAISTTINCSNAHQARLHLSGFRQEELYVQVNTCDDNDWIFTTFKWLGEATCGSQCGQFALQYPVCLGVPDSCDESYFVNGPEEVNKINLWIAKQTKSSESEPTLNAKLALLDDILSHTRALKALHRKLLGVLLAASLLQLYDSPWIQQQWHRDTVLIPSDPRDLARDMKRLQQWHPRILCTLSGHVVRKIQGEDIAAFGVLLMELEADEAADWTDEDTEWPSDVKSNRVRLARLLREWETVVSDEYRQIGRNCLDFENLSESFEHSRLGPEMKHLAILYKCILDPLFRCLVKDFGKAAQLFQGIPGPWATLSEALSISSLNVEKRCLFDEAETPRSDKRVGYAEKFLKDLEPFFFRISRLRSTSVHKLHDSTKIRIAVLDSGLDEKDPKIRGALASRRIDKRVSFVGQPDDCSDTYGHGTHIVKLLLQTAPAAVISVAKICDGKIINEEYMGGIAKAIDWAVDNVDAHIISMSFGFEDENDAIDAAVERAVEKGKLIFAAASNNGGISGRARPARNEDVLCIHASDGLGNKGDMNPSPLLDANNFSTLGVAVPFRWKGQDVWKSGTSFATPIAAAFAADVLEFCQHKCSLLPRRKQILFRRRGMQVVFREMSEKRDEYDFVHPGRLWRDGVSDQEVARNIEAIIRSL